MREHGHGVVRAQADLVRNFIRPPDDQPVHVREARLRRERGPAVDDHRLVAQLLREVAQRDGHLDGADDHEPGPNGIGLDEVLASAERHGPGLALLQGVARAFDEGRVVRGVARGTLQPAVVANDQGRRRRRPISRLVEPELGRRGIRRQGRHDRAPFAHLSGGRLGFGADRGLDEDVDRAAAREAHVPCLLVADPEPDDPGVAITTGPLDLLEGRALHAPAADGARKAVVVAHEQDRALRPRRRAERPHHHGTGSRVALRLPARQRVDQFLHDEPPRQRSAKRARGRWIAAAANGSGAGWLGRGTCR